MFNEPYTLPQPWTAAITGWVEWLTVAGCSAQTVRLRRSQVRMIAHRSGAPRPSDVTLEDLVAVCSARSWSNEYRRSLRASLTGFYEWAVEAKVCADNPARGLPKVPQSPPRPRPATDAVWCGLLAAAPPRERLMARLAGEAGLRRAEIAKVHADDLVADLCGWSLIVHGKGNKQRIVPLTDSLAGAIRAHSSSGFLFGGRIDGHLSPGHVGILLSRLMPAGWSAHKLRHRYASRGFAATGDLLAVQTALGHASVATTQRYVAVSSASVRAVSEAAA